MPFERDTLHYGADGQSRSGLDAGSASDSCITQLQFLLSLGEDMNDRRLTFVRSCLFFVLLFVWIDVSQAQDEAV